METEMTQTIALANRSVGPKDADSVPFYERVSIHGLVSPVSDAEFYARYWEKAPLIVHRCDPGYYSDLFTLKDFDESLKGGRGYVKTAEATTKKQAKLEGTGPKTLERVLTDMHEGRTLILDGVQDFNPKLGLMCRLLSQETGCRFQTNIYLTPPSGKGFQAHWDNHDVFVMQVMGSKRWQVEKTRRTLPATDGMIEEEGRELRGELHEFTLQQGDMVYIPRGFVHAAEAGPDSSLHVTLGIYYNSWDQLLRAAVTAAILGDDDLRLSLPAGHMKGNDAAIVKRLSEILHNTANPAFLTGVLEQFRDEIVQKAPLDISGQLISHFEPKPLTLGDQVGARPGLFYVIRKGADTVTLKVGTRDITFADLFGEALVFALETPHFAVRDLPGGLEDELKLVFIERLMQEALIIRT
jgi:ribosomal protein L16 Arg81 hydroxylase